MHTTNGARVITAYQLNTLLDKLANGQITLPPNTPHMPIVDEEVFGRARDSIQEMFTEEWEFPLTERTHEEHVNAA